MIKKISIWYENQNSIVKVLLFLLACSFGFFGFVCWLIIDMYDYFFKEKNE